jgi:multidrug/hemolysin transport system permease protein
MAILYQLILRNLRRYLRDKAAVFFSFLSVIIILGMYIMFLGKMQSDSLSSELGDIPGLNWLVSSWIMAGILMVSTVTVPLGAIGNLIDDRADGLLNDFYTSPISRNILALSYLISAWAIGFIMVMVNFVIGQIYVLSQGGELLGFIPTLKMLGLIIFSIMTFSSFFFYIAIFMKTRNAYGTLATLVGTFIGFLGGIYIPIGVLGKNVQTFMNALPTAHAVSIFRRVYMEGAIDFVFKGAPPGVYESYADLFGINVNLGTFSFESWHMLLSMAIFMMIFYVLSVLKLSRSKL